MPRAALWASCALVVAAALAILGMRADLEQGVEPTYLERAAVADNTGAEPLEAQNGASVRVDATSSPAAYARIDAPTASAAAHQRRFAYNLCALTHLKNRAPHFIQWVEYHLQSGFSQFYIVNDCSDDNFTAHAVLRFYADLGIVKYWPSPNSLLARGASSLEPPPSSVMDALDHAMAPECTGYVPNERRQIAQLATAARRDCQWVMVFDVDEYIVGEDASRYFGDVHAYLQSAPPSTSKSWWGLPVQYFAWIIMATHGLEQRPRHRLTIETYTRGRLDSGRQFKTVSARDCVCGTDQPW